MGYTTTKMKNQTKSFLPAIGMGGLANYIRQIQSFPILTAEEERKIADSWVLHHDKESAEKLVASHLRLVVSMAYELNGYGIPAEELVASGNMGLMQALQKFEPAKGFRFSTYATFWIRAEMYDFILNNWSLVKIGNSAAQKKVFFNLARTKQALGIMDSRLSGEQVKQIANKLEVSESVVERMSNQIHNRDASLNASKYDDGDGEAVDFLSDGAKPVEEELEEMETRQKGGELLRKHLAKLPERDREILILRRLSDPIKTLEELSEQYGISRERVRQIEDRAFSKLKTAMLAERKEE